MTLIGLSGGTAGLGYGAATAHWNVVSCAATLAAVVALPMSASTIQLSRDTCNLPAEYVYLRNGTTFSDVSMRIDRAPRLSLGMTRRQT